MTQADVTYLPIGSRIPRVLPSDCVLVHNHVRLARRQGTRGFRFWFQPLNATLERQPGPALTHEHCVCVAQLQESNERLRAEMERVQSNHVTVAEEIQRRHDACTPLTAEIEQLRAVAQAANDAYLAWTRDRSQEDLDSCMTILCALLDTWDTWREQQIRDASCSTRHF